MYGVPRPHHLGQAHVRHVRHHLSGYMQELAIQGTDDQERRTRKVTEPIPQPRKHTRAKTSERGRQAGCPVLQAQTTQARGRLGRKRTLRLEEWERHPVLDERLHSVLFDPIGKCVVGRSSMRTLRQVIQPGGCGFQHKAPHAARSLKRDVQRDPPSHGVTDKIKVIEVRRRLVDDSQRIAERHPVDRDLGTPPMTGHIKGNRFHTGRP